MGSINLYKWNESSGLSSTKEWKEHFKKETAAKEGFPESANSGTVARKPPWETWWMPTALNRRLHCEEKVLQKQGMPRCEQEFSWDIYSFLLFQFTPLNLKALYRGDSESLVFLYSWGNRGTEKKNALLKDTQQVSGRAVNTRYSFCAWVHWFILWTTLQALVPRTEIK